MVRRSRIDRPLQWGIIALPFSHAIRIDDSTEKTTAALAQLVSDVQTRIDTILSQFQTRIAEFEFFPDDGQRRLETVISEIEAQLTRFQKALGTIGDVGGVHAKRIDDLTDKSTAALAQLVTDVQTRIDTILSQFQTRIGEFEFFPDDAQGRLETVISEIEAQLTRFQEALGTIGDVGGVHAKRIDDLTEMNTAALAQLVTDVQARIDTILSQLQTRVGEFELFPVDTRGRLETVISEIEGELTRLKGSFSAIGDIGRSTSEAWEQAQLTLSKVSQRINQLEPTGARLAELNESVSHGAEAFDSLDASISALVSKIEETWQQIASQKDLITETSDSFCVELAELRRLRQESMEEAKKLVDTIQQVTEALINTFNTFTAKIRAAWANENPRRPLGGSGNEDGPDK